MLPSTVRPTAAQPPANQSAFLDSEFRYALFPPIYSLTFVLGILANIYVFYVIHCLRDARAMAEMRIYMANLTIADLLFVCALPLWIDYYSRRGDWIFSEYTCRFAGSLFFVNTYSSILFISAISMYRYWAIARPLEAASSDHRVRGIVVCLVIWAVTIGVCIPYLILQGTNKHNDGRTRCFEGYQNQTDSQKRNVAATHFTILGMFLVIFVLVVACNLLIVRNLLKQTLAQSQIRSSTGVKHRATQMLLAVLAVFVLCFLPHHVIQGPWALAVLQIQEGWGHVEWSEQTRQYLNDGHQVTLVFMSLNCILDPVVYYFATRKFRRFIVSHLKRLSVGRCCSYTSKNSVDGQH